MGSIVRMDPKPPSKGRDVSWPSPPTLLAQNLFFQIDRPDPPQLANYVISG